MGPNKNAIPGYRVFEYTLVIYPHEELAGRISKVKQQFAHNYKTEFALHGIPHITLARFTQFEMMETRIKNRLRLVAMGHPAFKTTVKDFGSFPTHSIYINVTSKLPLQMLVKTIRTDAQRLMKLNEEQKPHFILDPYIIIARKLKPWQYEKGWLEMSHRNFSGQFIAEGMTLLKRAAGELPFRSVEKFSFQNLPVVTRQGELFI